MFLVIIAKSFVKVFHVSARTCMDSTSIWNMDDRYSTCEGKYVTCIHHNFRE